MHAPTVTYSTILECGVCASRRQTASRCVQTCCLGGSIIQRADWLRLRSSISLSLPNVPSALSLRVVMCFLCPPSPCPLPSPQVLVAFISFSETMLLVYLSYKVS